MTSAFLSQLHLPPQDLAAPTLFEPNRAALQTWLDALPKANLGQTTRSLYHAATELNRVRLNPAQRLQLLEVLRPAIHYATAGLRRHYLNQPMQLPEQPQKVAQLAHALHQQIGNGYALAATQLAGSPQQAAGVASALHRALGEYSQNLLRAFLLYRAPPPGSWATLHRLAAFAQQNGVFAAGVADPIGGDSTLEVAYVRALLLGSARANQLRQDNIDLVFARALGWAAAVTLAGPEHGILVVDQHGDDGPIYREFVEHFTGGGWLGLDTAPLARELADQRQLAEAQSPDDPPLTSGDPQLTPELLAHLAQTWSAAGTREFLRTAVREPVEVSIGLTATHHFISGGIDFNLLLGAESSQRLTLQPQENPFLNPRPRGIGGRGPRDVWDSAYAPRPGVVNVSLEILEHELREQQQKTATLREREKFRSEAAERINVSPGGLCITWPPHSRVMLRTGEIVGVRENAQKNWTIGVIRWGQVRDDGTRLGIELLSPNAVPYGARPINKAGPQGEYLRVLVLPEVKQIGQPTTLLAPRLPFRVGQKVSLMCRNKETRAQLTRKIASTAAFTQFEFRRIAGVGDIAGSALGKDGAAGKDDDKGEGFDSLWDSL